MLVRAVAAVVAAEAPSQRARAALVEMVVFTVRAVVVAVETAPRLRIAATAAMVRKASSFSRIKF